MLSLNWAVSICHGGGSRIDRWHWEDSAERTLPRELDQTRPVQFVNWWAKSFWQQCFLLQLTVLTSMQATLCELWMSLQSVKVSLSLSESITAGSRVAGPQDRTFRDVEIQSFLIVTGLTDTVKALSANTFTKYLPHIPKNARFLLLEIFPVQYY